MANMTLKDMPVHLQKAIQFYAEFGGFGNEYQAVLDSRFKNENFLAELENHIEKKNYKNILQAIAAENLSILDESGQLLPDDQKTIRQALRRIGFHENDFYNPKYDKGDLVSWEGNLFKIRGGFMDNGANYYSLTHPVHGHEVGGRLREDEILEPSTIQMIRYYKERDMLDVHLFNKLAFMPDGKFDINKCRIEKFDLSVTQGSHTLYYDDKEVVRYDAGKKLDGSGNWVGISDEERFHTLESLYYFGDPLNNIKPLKEAYGLSDKLGFLKAVKGIADPEGKFGEISRAAANGEIDKLSQFNLYAMLSHDSHAPVKIKGAPVADDELAAMEQLAIRRLRNNDGIETLFGQFSVLRHEIDRSGIPDEQKSNLLNESAFHAISRDTLPSRREIGDMYGNVRLNRHAIDWRLLGRLEDVYDHAINCIMERDMLDLQRPDIEPFIKTNKMYKDPDKNLFRGSWPDGYYAAQRNAVEKLGEEWRSLDIAMTDYRWQHYNEDLLVGHSYCEGDTTLEVFKDRDEMVKSVYRAIQSYGEDAGMSAEKIEALKEEFMPFACVETMVSPESQSMSPDERATELGKLAAGQKQTDERALG